MKFQFFHKLKINYQKKNTFAKIQFGNIHTALTNKLKNKNNKQKIYKI